MKMAKNSKKRWKLLVSKGFGDFVVNKKPLNLLTTFIYKNIFEKKQKKNVESIGDISFPKFVFFVVDNSPYL
jgi:hypothetical protein